MSTRSTIACAAGEWHLHVWSPQDPSATEFRVPYVCRSWRHEGPCRQWKGAQDFVRCADGLSRCKYLSYMVLTFAQRNWASEWDQAKFGVVAWARLRKRIFREFGRFRYLQTWEAHQKRGFHANVAIDNSDIQAQAASLAEPDFWPWLMEAAEDCGFGWRIWAEPLRQDSAGLAGYLTKLSRELTGAGAKNQVPIRAPPHFRRLRASRGLLPAVHHGDYTGRLVQAPLSAFGSPSAIDKHRLGTENACVHTITDTTIWGPAT